MRYRADIDGLRAIAIIFVLIYHGGFTLFPSGFIGVDIFFVISGFLITTIIHESLTEGHFSFIEFYQRRLWRLQPVLVCFLLVISLLALFFLLPEDLIQYSNSARKTSLFISNLYFNRTTTGYFSPDTRQLPLLHMWSLSIEWQCYLILPLVVYGLHRLCRKYLVAIVYLFTLACFILCLHYSKSYPAQTYYQFSSRIFEFLIGACITLIPMKKRVINSYFLNGAGGLALSLLFYIASLDHLLLGYPDWYALSACMATGCLITLGKFYPTQFFVRFLSFKPLVFIGLLSYSLYIWHWPVFALLRYYGITETPTVLLAVYGIVFIVAYLSWNYIEKPARQFKTIPFHYTLASLLLLPILFAQINAYLIKAHDGFPSRFSKELVTIYQQLGHYASTQRSLCMSGDQDKVNLECILGAKKTNSKTGFMIGDSFSNHYWGFMDTIGKNADVSILAQGVSSCITLPGIYLYDWWHYKNLPYQTCYNLTQKYYRMIQENHYDYVILGQLWTNYISNSVINKLGDERSIELAKKRLEVALDKALALITGSGAKPVLINTNALMEKNFHDCFFKHIKLRKSYEPGHCNFKLILTDADQWISQLFGKMKIKYPQLIFIDPKKVQCERDICKVDINGIPVYRDAGHITDYASYQFGQQYLKKFSNPLLI
ncbi:acyltransferase family protein [Legionella sp.]|uniref:acyltransferase family protein n=1 Tax=Legionella sp. TaxID=459 RepID=UPI003CA638B1